MACPFISNLVQFHLGVKCLLFSISRILKWNEMKRTYKIKKNYIKSGNYTQKAPNKQHQIYTLSHPLQWKLHKKQVTSKLETLPDSKRNDIKHRNQTNLVFQLNPIIQSLTRLKKTKAGYNLYMYLSSKCKGWIFTNFLHVPHHTITTRLSISLFRSTLHYAQNTFSI